MKLFFIIVEILLAAVFVGTSFTTHRSIAAVFEWIIAVIFTFYVLTFFVDLLPASQNHHKTMNLEMGHVDRATVAHQNGYAAGGMEINAGAVSGQQPKPPMAQNY